MRIIAIIPARMGSKRLPRKNALEIERGLSLVQHAIDCANDSGVIDQVSVLTDDPGLRYERAHHLQELPHLAADGADISIAVAHATDVVERGIGRVDYVVTLQPAVLARSPLIVKRLVQAVTLSGYGGGVTAARTVPWQWTVRDTAARNAWFPGSYPRSQAAPHHLAEVNAVQVASRAAVAAGHRWALPLILAELPAWSPELDIDEPRDLAAARDLWPWARPRLETWEPTMHLAATINGDAA